MRYEKCENGCIEATGTEMYWSPVVPAFWFTATDASWLSMAYENGV